MPLIAEGDEEDRRERATLKCSQCVGGLVATLAAFSIGTYLSWTSAVLPATRWKDTLPFFDWIDYWNTSMIFFGAIPGSLSAKILANKFGRKWTIWTITLLLFSCWYIIVFVWDDTWLSNQVFRIEVFLLARFIAGVSCGAASVVVPMYISEIADRSTRSLFGTFFHLQITAGILFTYAIAFTDSLYVITILCSVAPALLLISFPFMPESPMWLVMQGRRNEAYDALRHFRGSSRHRIETELTRLEQNVRLQANIVDLRHYPRPVCITLGLMILQQLSGVSALIFYMSYFFHITEVTSLSPITSSVIVGIVQIIAACFSIVIIKRANKKLLLFISASIMATSMFTLSGYFHFLSLFSRSNLISVSFFWIPLLSMSVFVTMFNLGFGPIPWMMIGELFTSNMRSAASFAATICSWMIAFLVTNSFPAMVKYIDAAWSFGIFGMINLFGIVFISTLVSETKGKSVEEVQIELYRDRNRILMESMTET